MQNEQLQAAARDMVVKLAGAMGVDISPVVAMEVVRIGEKVIIPEGASIPEVIDALRREYESENQNVNNTAKLDVPPWDGARALSKAIERELGFVVQYGNVAGSMDVEVGLDQIESVQWGSFVLPGLDDAAAATTVAFDDETGRWQFQCTIRCKRRQQKRAKRVLDTMREIARQESLHKGKAFSMKYVDEDGDRIGLPKPKFFPLVEDVPIYRRSLEEAIDRNIFVNLRHADALRQIGETLKRGVVLAGDYGMGKTLLASHIARVAVGYGWTFMYVKDPRELSFALKEATHPRLWPIVVFCEDADRVAGSERTHHVNTLLNQLDGIDSKTAQIMTIITTNHKDQIQMAMRRPGRIDSIIEVLPPDADAIERMVRKFVGDGLAPDADISQIGEVLEGYAPAFIREAVGRARREALRRTGDPTAPIIGDDLAKVALEVRREKDFFEGETPEQDTDALSSLAVGLQGAGRVMETIAEEQRKTTRGKRRANGEARA